MMSVAAPGPVGTINLTGRLGQDCALASQQPSRMNKIASGRRLRMVDLPITSMLQ
jgi:hypothetical protein